MNPKLICGDALEQLKLLGDNTIDALVTDPPAGIGFMGKEWDHHKGGRDEWIKWLRSIMEEALRVLKPGGHGLVWALPRTSHWTATALEDAGFEVRDCVYHVFGSGFPKSLNVGKAIDKLQGNEREIVGTQMLGGNAAQTTKEKGGTYASNTDAIGVKPIEVQLTKGSTVWEGWGTALKPAVECWWLVRKPLEASTVAKNVLQYGTGALNIDASRIATDEKLSIGSNNHEGNTVWSWKMKDIKEVQQQSPLGRWPSHLIHDGSDEVLEHFPQTHKAGNLNLSNTTSDKSVFGIGAIGPRNHDPFGDSGSAARFFYCAKPSKAERNHRLEALEGERTMGKDSRERPTPLNKNHHPTVKGQALMRYLITLITPPEGTVLDMFMGSGSTGVAAKALGHSFVGIELDPEYFKIAQARITKTKVGEPLEYDPPVTVDENQLELFETGENHNERTLH